MKRFIGITILMILFIMEGQSLKAQKFKFGHINSDELILEMPEFDSARIKLDRFRKELINHLELMSSELNHKNEVYNKESKNLSDVVRNVKEQEMMDMNRRIQEFQDMAQTQLQEKQLEFFQPVYAKVEKAIQDVGKENDYLYIFKSLIYFDKAISTDVTDMVKVKLKLR